MIRGVSEYDVLRVYALDDMAWPHDRYKETHLEAIKVLIFERGLHELWEDYRRNPKHQAQIEAFETQEEAQTT